MGTCDSVTGVTGFSISFLGLNVGYGIRVRKGVTGVTARPCLPEITNLLVQ